MTAPKGFIEYCKVCFAIDKGFRQEEPEGYLYDVCRNCAETNSRGVIDESKLHTIPEPAWGGPDEVA